MRKLLHCLLAVLLALPVRGQVSGRVLEAGSGMPVTGAAVTGGNAWTLTDTTGRFTLRASSSVQLTVTCLGYKSFTGPVRTDGIYRLQPDIMTLQEVVVTATEDHGLTATSRIGEDAIRHIQPSSIADVLELLPGGLARDPAFGSAQIVNLRAAGSLSSDYATSALGTRFLIDGKPVGGDANLQSTPVWSNLGGDFVNLGTDMRTLSTEDIESVDVVRGIASVEYGDLTSGLVKINRRKGGNDWRARFKADMKSKLFYVGRDMEWGDSGKRTLNVSANYLDSRSDPRNPRQNYSRLTGSTRFGRAWDGSDRWHYVLGGSLDYTGSFDTQKSDVDLDTGIYGPIETYRSDYHKFALGVDFTWTAKQETSFFRSLALAGSLTYERDLIDRWKYNILGTERPLSTSLDPGEHDVISLPTRYEAALQVDGRPFYAFLNAVAQFKAGVQRFKAGVEWTMDKNYGKGTIFDPERPFSPSMNVRPRPYSAIPANHQLSAFLEDQAVVPLGGFRLDMTAGLRAGLLLGAGKAYAVNGKLALDPRVNLRLQLPLTVLGGHKLLTGVFGGLGFHTKFPTMDMLFPGPMYGDITQFNYWPVEPELRRINILVYKIEPVNYALQAARNFKWEVGFDAEWNGYSLSVNWFREDMTSGFRNGSKYEAYTYKDYDEQSVDKSALTGPPSLDDVPFAADTMLVAYGLTTNGSRTLKQGLEFTFSSRRLPAIRTRLTFNGAWFITQYTNSTPEYYRPSVTLGGKNYPYIGMYDHTDGSKHISLTTNLMADTQIPRLGLIVTTSFQTTWFTDYVPLVRDEVPEAWLDKNLTRHPFTQADALDPVLRYLLRGVSALDYDYRVPFAMNINLKVTKKLYRDRASVSLFVNRILDVTPDYRSNGTLNRRNVDPYFGMELDFKL